MFIFERIKRIKIVSKFASKNSKLLAEKEGKGRWMRRKIYIDMLYYHVMYGVWTDQYLDTNFHRLPSSEKKIICKKAKEKLVKRDAWVQDFLENRKFLNKYGNIKYEKGLRSRRKRRKAYTKKYNAGFSLDVEYDVNISRQHYLEGTISIGNNVLFAKHSFIDYSGELIIHDNVKITDGVSIETHSHPGFISTLHGLVLPGKLEIFENVNIGTKSVITESCHSIGRYAKIGAGSVVRRNIPPYAIVIGNPAKIIGFIFTPSEMEAFEKEKYAENNRTSIEQYSKLYNKYYKSRIKEIKVFLQS